MVLHVSSLRRINSVTFGGVVLQDYSGGDANTPGRCYFPMVFGHSFLAVRCGLHSASCCGCRSISVSCRCQPPSRLSTGISTRCSTAMWRPLSPVSCSPPFLIGRDVFRSMACRCPPLPLWLAGRVAVAGSAIWGAELAAVIDIAFLAALAVLAAREIAAGRNWRNLRVLIMLGVLIAGNVVFHAE